jgi:hypothetical protein
MDKKASCCCVAKRRESERDGDKGENEEGTLVWPNLLLNHRTTNRLKVSGLQTR